MLEKRANAFILIFFLSLAMCKTETHKVGGSAFVVDLKKLNNSLTPDDLNSLFGTGGLRDTVLLGDATEIRVAPAKVLGYPSLAHFIFNAGKLREAWFFLGYDKQLAASLPDEVELQKKGEVWASAELFDSVLNKLKIILGNPMDTSYLGPGHRIITFRDSLDKLYLTCSFESVANNTYLKLLHRGSNDTTKGMIMLHPLLRYY